MNRWNCMLAMALSACVLTVSEAGKPDKTGGGGKGDSGSTGYTLAVLDNGPGIAKGINQAGEVVGYLMGANGDVPYHWTVSESGLVIPTRLPLGTFAWGRAHDINQAGMIVGEGLFWFNKESFPLSPPVPLDTGRVRAEAINDHGIIVGSYEDPSGNDHAAAWAVRANGTITNPLDLGSGYAICWDVNDSDVAVGETDEIAMRWQLAWDGQSLDLLSVQPLFTSSELIASVAKGINDSGDICGTLQTAGSDAEAFLLMQLEDVQIPVPLPENDNSRQDVQNTNAFALNNATLPQVLGKRDVVDLRRNSYREWDAPVLWQGDQTINLEHAVPFFLSGEAISDSGWIVGQGYNDDAVFFPIVIIPR